MIPLLGKLLFHLTICHGHSSKSILWIYAVFLAAADWPSYGCTVIHSASLLMDRQAGAPFVSYISQSKGGILVPVHGTYFSRSLEWEHTQYLDQHTCN